MSAGPTPAPTHLQLAIRHAIARSGKARDHFDNLLRKKLGTSGKPIYDIDRGKSKKPGLATIQAIAEVFELPVDFFLEGRAIVPAAATTTPPADEVATVGVQYIDLDFGLGATFTDSHVSVEVLQFPKVWIDSITSSPPSLLTWSRGRGDSMFPTISDGDLVLLDRSKRRVEEQDAIWAFTVGDVGAIKRLRVKGDRFQIFSDNPAVPPDEEPIDFVNIVGRVIFVGMRK